MIERNVTIDVLIPSRQRAALLDHSVQSLHNTATNPERVNFLVAVDLDDPERLLYDKIEGILHIPVYPRYGYRQLHRYYNLLARSASNWMLVWNDDALITPYYGVEGIAAAPRKGWDEVIAAEDHTVPNVLNFTGALNLFPAVSRPFYEVLGHLSLQAHVDTWIQEVARAARIERQLFGAIQIDHMRDRIDDETKRETQAAYATTSPEFLSREMQRLREQDVKKLKEALDGTDKG